MNFISLVIAPLEYGKTNLVKFAKLARKNCENLIFLDIFPRHEIKGHKQS